MSHKKCFWYRIDISEGIDINKSKECMLCHFFDRNFRYRPYLCYKIFLLYKMSSTTDYQRNRDVMLNRAKEYYENNKERLREQARDKYRNMSEEKKQKIKEYQKNYREAKKIIMYTGKINNELICGL